MEGFLLPGFVRDSSKRFVRDSSGIVDTSPQPETLYPPAVGLLRFMPSGRLYEFLNLLHLHHGCLQLSVEYMDILLIGYIDI